MIVLWIEVVLILMILCGLLSGRLVLLHRARPIETVNRVFVPTIRLSGEKPGDDPYPYVTWAAIADTLPARIVDAIEATAPCPNSLIGRHIWDRVVHEINQMGQVRPVRSDNFWQCYACKAAVDDKMYRELVAR